MIQNCLKGIDKAAKLSGSRISVKCYVKMK